MGAWQDARRASFLQMVALWPIAMTYLGVAPPSGAIATSTAYELQQQRNDMFPKKPVTFSILREDYLVFETAGMKPRENVVSDGITLQIVTVNDDPSDSMVDIRCVLNQ